MLKWDKPDGEKVKNSKFQRLWLGPYLVVEKLGLSTYRLQNIEGELDLLPINSQVLKIYFI